MLLTITSTTVPATDLGYVLHKNPHRAQEFHLAFGKAHVFYPEAEDERCTVALLLEVDPIGLVRGRRGPSGEGRALEQYVNDRPYVASSFLSVAMADVFGTALTGRSQQRAELAERAIPLEARISVLPCRGGETFLRRLFEPLGYVVHVEPHVLDEQMAWGMSHYFTVTLTGTKRVAELLTHLYVLVPVLDDDKHYWVGDDEVAKLVRRGDGWLPTHPERDVIARRYLRHQRSLARDALERLSGAEATPGADDVISPSGATGEMGTGVETGRPEETEQPLRLNELRIQAVVAALRESGAARVLDLGCGSGQLLRALHRERGFREIVGVDVSHRALENASERLRLDEMTDTQRARLKLLHGSLVYRDERLVGFDAAAIVEVIEHLDLARLAAFERVVFEFARPGTVVVTTPNAEYNVKYETLDEHGHRHHDHRFEWSRAEFEAWTERVAGRFGYRVRVSAVGPEDEAVGAPTQMAVFTR